MISRAPSGAASLGPALWILAVVLATVPAEAAPARADLAVTLDDGGPRAMTGRGVVYRIRVTNGGPDAVTGAHLHVPVPEGLAEAAWTCRASAGASCGPPRAAAKDGGGEVGGRGAIDRRPDLGPGSAVELTLRGILVSTAPGRLVATASVSPPPGVDDPDPRNDRATDVDRIVTPFSFWKRIEGDRVPGGEITYTLWAINTTSLPQPDLLGPEIVDVLPDELELLEATASFGTVTTAAGERLVRWSGELPPREILGIVLRCRIAEGTERREVVNRGELRHALTLDATRDLLGTSASNDTLALSEDFDTGGPTVFRVLRSVLPIPALDAVGLALLALALGLAAVRALAPR